MTVAASLADASRLTMKDFFELNIIIEMKLALN